MPRLGLTMEEGTIGSWLIAEGDGFEEGQVIMEITTDKAVNEVAAEFKGRLTKILVAEDDSCSVGDPVAEAEES